jgi:hypothetical protein
MKMRKREAIGFGKVECTEPGEYDFLGLSSPAREEHSWMNLSI